MHDQDLNTVRMALEAAYDTLKQPASDYLDQSDFEADRLDAVEKMLRAMKVLDLDTGLVSNRLDITSDCPVSVVIIAES